jgi:hypothetical protein
MKTAKPEKCCEAPEYAGLSEQWERGFAELAAFQKKRGHCRVPWGGPLGRWCCQQRKSLKKGRLSEKRIRRLDGIGFVWNRREEDWWGLFERLKVFKKKHGHCDVPRHSREDRALSLWVRKQRNVRKCRLLSEDRAKALERLGFTWSVSEKRDADWMAFYERYKGYVRVHGRLLVNRKWHDQELKRWADRQRQARRKGYLSSRQIRLLDGLGFVWKARVSRRGKWLVSTMRGSAKR